MFYFILVPWGGEHISGHQGAVGMINSVWGTCLELGGWCQRSARCQTPLPPWGVPATHPAPHVVTHIGVKLDSVCNVRFKYQFIWKGLLPLMPRFPVLGYRSFAFFLLICTELFFSCFSYWFVWSSLYVLDISTFCVCYVWCKQLISGYYFFKALF